MSVPAYPVYRDSEAAWLGQIPKHWNARPIRYFATSSGGGTPNREVPEFWNGDIPWVSPKDMKTETIHGSEEAITAAGLRGSATSMVEPGAVLLVVRSGILKHTIPVAINVVPVTLNQDMKALRMDSRVCLPKYFARVVQGSNDIFLHLWAKQGATVESIEQDYLNETVFPLPPLAEQTAIAIFLDRETGKIDALVAEQERLMALLKEKRQAVISQAVTKGLDPNMPMKDSGVEWLGEVPAHWNVTTVRRVAARIQAGATPPTAQEHYFLDGTVPWFGPSSFDDSITVRDPVKFLNKSAIADGVARLFADGSVLIIAIGATLGSVRI